MKWRMKLSIIIVLLVGLFPAPAAATPLTWTVNSTDDVEDGTCDSTHCSLREAVNSAASGDQIEFDLATPATITLTGSQIVIDKDLTIAGPGADQLAISGANLSRVLSFPDAYDDFSVTVSGLTIKEGYADIGGGVYLGHHAALSMNDCVIGPGNSATIHGGGIANVRGVLTLNRCTVMQNQAADYATGAGIYAGATPETGSLTTLVNSTVSGNVTNNAGGGIYAVTQATVILNHCTVTGNIANGDNSVIGGGGISSHAYGTVQLQNSIVAGNVDLAAVNTPSPDLARWTSYPQGTLTSLGGNLIGDSTGSSIFWNASDQVGDNVTPIDPFLAALALNAPGTTPAHALLTGSPAIDKVDCPAEVTIDQRGVARPQGSSCDTGSYEEENTQYLTMAVTPAGGGTTTPPVGVHTYALDSVVPITATSAVGYEFSHWTPDDTPGDPIANPYAASTTVTMDADYTVTAHFAPIVHTLAVNTVGYGTVTKDPDIDGPYNYGTEVELTAIPDSGWLFDGWSGDLSGLNNPETITMDAGKIVTATFTMGHTVTFNANGGSGTIAPQTSNVATALTLNSFTRVGYTFSSWNTEAEGGGTTYADGATYDFSEDLDLYAQWTALPDRTVTFNANGGTGTMAPQTANVATALTLNSFTRTGYTFSDWNTEAEGGGTAYADGETYDFSADMDLYAQWVALPDHTVTFNANGGTGTMAPQTSDVPTALTLNSFTRTGYTFSGWNTEAEGGGTDYADGATYDFSADITLYAQWARKDIPLESISVFLPSITR